MTFSHQIGGETIGNTGHRNDPTVSKDTSIEFFWRIDYSILQGVYNFTGLTSEVKTIGWIIE
jgi:hypothetical protein